MHLGVTGRSIWLKKLLQDSEIFILWKGYFCEKMQLIRWDKLRQVFTLCLCFEHMLPTYVTKCIIESSMLHVVYKSLLTVLLCCKHIVNDIHFKVSIQAVLLFCTNKIRYFLYVYVGYTVNNNNYIVACFVYSKTTIYDTAWLCSSILLQITVLFCTTPARHESPGIISSRPNQRMQKNFVLFFYRRQQQQQQQQQNLLKRLDKETLWYRK